MVINVKPSNTKRRPLRNYFRRREQWRLLVLVMGLGLVFVMMREAAREENWHWLTGQENKNDAAYRQERDYDTAYQPTLPSDNADTVRIVAEEPLPPDNVEGYFPGVVPRYLARVQDNRTHEHPEEAAAWFNLWRILRVNDDEFIDPESTGPATFGELFEQPEFFRGKLVTLEGTVRRAEYVRAAKNNSAEVAGYYRLILRLRGGPSRLIFLYTLQLPKDFPIGDQIDAQIKATAFFYKNWLYSDANEHSWIAPVLLAKSVRWQKEPAPGNPITLSMAIITTLGIALFSVLLARWLMKRSTSLDRNSQKMRYTTHAPPEINPEEVEQKTRDHLRDLASEEASCDP